MKSLKSLQAIRSSESDGQCAFGCVQQTGAGESPQTTRNDIILLHGWLLLLLLKPGIKMEGGT